MNHAPQPECDPPRKATLYCPICAHQSPIEGDWVVRERATGVEYRCPDCETGITERDREQPPIARTWSAWVRAASAWFRPSRRLRV